MNFKKNILIVGPIGDFGGREIMTNLLVCILKNIYDIHVLSTISMTKKSSALKNIDIKKWDTINLFLYRGNLIFRLTGFLTKVLNNRKPPGYLFINNKFTKPFYNFNKLYIQVIQHFVKKTDLIIYSGEINGKWLEEIIEMTCQLNKSLLIRITGEIKTIPDYILNNNSKFVVLVHSKQNANILGKDFYDKVKHIDQPTINEDNLLALEIKENEYLVYGFLGRFGQEKGIMELIDVFSKNNHKLLIAGNGPFLEEVVIASKKNKNIDYKGEISSSELSAFFDKIDVLVIPSFEEGGPIVGVEAMAAGKLIISTRVGAMPERLNQTENDFWFSHELSSSLMSVISRVESLGKLKRLEIRKKIRQKYISYNALEVFETKYIELVENLIK